MADIDLVKSYLFKRTMGLIPTNTDQDFIRESNQSKNRFLKEYLTSSIPDTLYDANKHILISDGTLDPLNKLDSITINNNNNTLKYSINGVSQTDIIITEGLYTYTTDIHSIITELNLTSITVTYNVVLKRFIFENEGNAFIFHIGSTCLEALGFDIQNNIDKPSSIFDFGISALDNDDNWNNSETIIKEDDLVNGYTKWKYDTGGELKESTYKNTNKTFSEIYPEYNIKFYKNVVLHPLVAKKYITWVKCEDFDLSKPNLLLDSIPFNHDINNFSYLPQLKYFNNGANSGEELTIFPIFTGPINWLQNDIDGTITFISEEQAVKDIFNINDSDFEWNNVGGVNLNKDGEWTNGTILPNRFAPTISFFKYNGNYGFNDLDELNFKESTIETKLTIKGEGKIKCDGSIYLPTAAGANGFLYFDDNFIIQHYNDGLNFCPEGKDYSLFISDDGNVGIGKHSPSEALDVNGNIKIEGQFRPTLKIHRLPGSDDYMLIDDYMIACTNSSGLYLRTESSGGIHLQTDSDTKMVILNGGNVGIGITNPIYKLDVDGTTHISSTLTVDGDNIINSTTESANTGTGALQVKGGVGIMKQLMVGGDAKFDNIIYGWLDTQSNIKLAINTKGQLRYGNTSVLTWNNNFFVGIGIESPQYKLDVNGNTRFNGNVGINTDPSTYGLVVQNDVRFNSNLKVDGILTVSDIKDSAGNIRITTGSDTVINATNFIVTATLQLNNNIMTSGNGDTVLQTSGDNILFPGNVSIGGWDDRYPLFCNTNNGDSVQGYFKNSKYNLLLVSNSLDGYNLNCKYNNTSNFVVKSNGKVGIGTDNPSYPLHITKTAEHSIILKTYHIGGGTNWVEGAAAAVDSDISVYATNNIVAAKFSVFSDQRIKENIRDVPDDLSLKKLRDINCYYYEYKDKVKMGNDSTIGFIAQQVKEHMPMAVSTNKEIIPNELRILTNYKWVAQEDNKYKLIIYDLSNNVGNTLYRFYLSNNITEDNAIHKDVYSLENEPKKFIFDNKWDNIFLYGKQVDDFNILDKQKIFALNFSATQEIDRKQQTDEIEINILKNRVKSLEDIILNMQNRLDILEAGQ